MSTLVLIPARGGSKGVNRKNMQLLDGVPLVIRAALEAKQLEGHVQVVVSSEDPEILTACTLRGVDVLPRPASLSGDDVPLMPVIQHAVNVFSHHETVLVLQPTTVLPAFDLQGVLDQFKEARRAGVDACFCTVVDPHVFWQDGYRMSPYVQRQQLLDSGKAMQREVGVRVMTHAYAMTGSGSTGTIELDQAPDVDTYDDFADLERRAQRRWVELNF